MKPAEIHVIDSLESDPFSDTVERDSIIENEKEYDNLNADFQEDRKAVEEILNQTIIIEESIDLENPVNETIVDEIQATITSPPVDEAVIKTVSIQEPLEEKVESENTETTTIEAVKPTTPFKTTLIQEVPTTTPKYNFTQNNNTGVANLDRKILAFEVDFHNKRILAEKFGQGSISLPKAEISFEEGDAGILNAQEDEKEHPVSSELNLPEPKPQDLKLRDFEQEHIFPHENSEPGSQRKLLDSSVIKTRHIISNYVEPRNQVGRIRKFRSFV